MQAYVEGARERGRPSDNEPTVSGTLIQAADLDIENSGRFLSEAADDVQRPGAISRMNGATVDEVALDGTEALEQAPFDPDGLA